MNPSGKHKNLKSKKPRDADIAKPIAACRRCGRCCRNGGPSFHHADKGLIEKGIIHCRFLYTIRKGELAYDNVRGCLQTVGSDIIKLKGKQGSWTCRFFDESQKACRIYENRPLECRALKCWDTSEIESIYAENRLSRKDLIAKIEGLWDLIEDHQTRCDYETIRRLVTAVHRYKKEAARCMLIEIIRYDTEMRKLVVSKGGLDAEMLDFLFGRPLLKTLENFGLKVRQNGAKINLMPADRRQIHSNVRWSKD
jgi:Fe-S-cluster containining protein